MEFSDVLAQRRMVRSYTSEPVSDDALERIASAAFRAPSAGNTAAVGLVIVTDDRIRGEIARLADEPSYLARGFDPWISAAPAHIVISVSEEAYRSRYREPDKTGSGAVLDWPVPYWWVDAGAALMCVLLAAIDEGLSAGFLGAHSVPGLGPLLAIPDDQRPIGVVTVGHGAPDRRSSSLDRQNPDPERRIYRNRWSARAD